MASVSFEKQDNKAGITYVLTFHPQSVSLPNEDTVGHNVCGVLLDTELLQGLVIFLADFELKCK